MNDLIIFKNEEFGEIRTLTRDGEPWFVAKDIAKILNYRETANMRKLIDEFDYMEIDPQNVANTGFVQNGTILEPNKNIRRMLLINESGLYQAIFSSTLPKAKRFKRWVTSEVLPAIGKHGMYATDRVLERTLEDPDFMINILNNLKQERAKRMLAETEIERNRPKVLFADTVSASKSSCLVGELAKLIKQEAIRRGVPLKSFGQNTLFRWLRDNGYLCKGGERKNQPTQRYVDSGLFELKKGCYIDSFQNNVVTTTTKVTGKGQIYFVNKFLGA